MTEEMPRDMQVVKDVARIIWPEALDGETENGRLDEHVAYEKAEGAFDEVITHASQHVKDRLRDALRDYQLVSAEQLSDLRECVSEGDVNGIFEVIDNLQEPDEFVDELEFTFED